MNYRNYQNLVTLLLLLCLWKVNAQVSCAEGNFEQQNLSNNYTMQTAINANTQGCSTSNVQNLGVYNFPPGFPPINNVTTPVSFVSQQNEPTLQGFSISHPQVNPDGGGGFGLRLNARSTKVIEENTTVLTRDLGTVTERYLKLDYSAIFHVPDHPHDLNFVKFSIINRNTGFIIDEKCLDANDINGIDSSDATDDLITVNGGVPTNTWRYNDWSCLSFDLNKYVGKKSNLELRIIAADCGEALHDTVLYVDNICFDENSCECIDGTISMNPININCPSDDPFTVSGSYALPTCDGEDPTDIVLTLVPYNPNTGNTGIPVVISQSNFSNGIYSFNVNPSTLNLDDSLEYDLVATANFSDGSSWSVSDSGKEITFINCEVDCSEYWVAILDEYIDGTQSGSNYVYLMANGNYPSGATYTWTTTRQNGSVQTYVGGNIILVDASISNRIVSATVTVTYEDCSETVRKRFDCAIPNADANGNLFPECNNSGGGFGRTTNEIRIYPNPVNSSDTIKIQGLESYDINGIEIVDMFGNIKSFQKTDSNNVRLGNLNTGIYFVKISTKQGVIQKKIIVN